mmetsp:Transcript_17381/g.49755  ORF Transcript_17381/g.49755 Transcript_17381/m.49755 type:complete len:285 (+) Transcript_17381:725-1579(+)
MSSTTRSATLPNNLGPLRSPTVNRSVTPKAESGSLSNGRFSCSTRAMFRSRSFSSCLSRSKSSVTFRSASPSGPRMVASFGRTHLPSFSSRSLARCRSAAMASKTLRSTSPSGPGTSIGRTNSPPRCLISCARIFSAEAISLMVDTARASASPNGPRFPSSISLGRSILLVALSRSDCRIRSKKLTTLRSKRDNGPPSPASSKSIGRTNSPSELAMRLALFPSSSMTPDNHDTTFFSARPSGPRFSSLASIGLRYAASSPIILANDSSTCRSASVLLKREERHW